MYLPKPLSEALQSSRVQQRQTPGSLELALTFLFFQLAYAFSIYIFWAALRRLILASVVTSVLKIPGQTLILNTFEVILKTALLGCP